MNRKILLGLWVGLVLLLSQLSMAQQIAYPDLQVKIPTAEISIGHPTPSTRELRFSHITWNGGAGPLEIRPVYDPVTGVAQGFQRLYTYDSAGNLKLVMESPIAIPMVFVPPDDYHFAIAQFGLYFDAGGSIGALASPSPKSDFCIGSNTVIGGLPHTPATSNLGDCENPNGRLGLSVGWGDKYDYTDTGENIDITTLPDGVYWLRGIADPFHYLLAVSPENNITDTQLRISGDTVTILQQIRPDSTPPTIAIASPAAGASLSSSVVLDAIVTSSPTSVQSVKFLVDGNTLPGTVTANPPHYTITWNTAGAGGPHLISAQVTASISGFVGTAIPVAVTVPAQIGSLVVDQRLSVDASSTILTTPSFSTSAPGELLLALVSADGPPASQSQSTTVAGAGLSWSLVSRSNTQFGTAEIWAANAASVLTNVTVTSTEKSPDFDQSLTLLALRGASAVGAHSAASGSKGAPTVSVTTTGNGSWVLGAGNDWDSAVARSLGSNQQMLHQWVDTTTGDTFWSQATTAAIASRNTVVTVNDRAPTADRWNLVAVEVLVAGSTPPDNEPPTADLLNPVGGQVLSGTVTVSAKATDNTAVSSVKFLVDQQPLAGQITSNPPQYAISWDTSQAANGPHTVGVVATDPSGNSNALVPIDVSVSNPAPPKPCFIVDATASARGNGAVTTPGFRTALPGELLVAFAASDGPTAGGQTLKVSGAGLTWKLVKRGNSQPGSAEVWVATAPAALMNAKVTATAAKTGFDLSLYVIAVQGANGIGASAAAGALTGPPSVTLQTTKPASLVYGVGNDWETAIARTPGLNQIIDNQWIDTRTGDTYWVQNETFPPAIPAGASVTLNDTAPTNGRWNFVAVEILAQPGN